ncbi:MAG TPA: hypothetical protein VGZ00_01040 [Candidatus Baltobacteraceae bacterium]|jgi:hypothetical protein|nr:hypothetical protein [Candidatus Baltobacteraceae bacterium]
MDKKTPEPVASWRRARVSFINAFSEPHTINFTVAYLCGLGLTIDSIVTSAFPKGKNAEMVFFAGVASVAAGVISLKLGKKSTPREVLMITSGEATQAVKAGLNSRQSSESQERAPEPPRDPDRVHLR